MKKYCTKCGREFIAVGREVICPSCKAAAQEDAKRAAVLRAKKASWAGESVPVRISGRASTLIRKYGEANSLSFAESLDALLKESDCFKGMNVKWEDITPYKSRRRDKHATEDVQDGKQEAQEAPQASKPQEAPQDVKQAAKASRTSTAKKAAGASKTAAKKGGKA